jgi:hypothetical protein
MQAIFAKIGFGIASMIVRMLEAVRKMDHVLPKVFPGIDQGKPTYEPLL